MALAFFLAPLPTTLYSLVLFLALSAFNIVRHRLSHGLYQFLLLGLDFHFSSGNWLLCSV